MVHGTRGDLGDDKVEEPLCGGGETDTVGTQAGGKDLFYKLVQ